MYTIRARSKVGKQFRQEIKRLKVEEKIDLLTSLQESPFNNQRKGQFYSYDLPDGHRILYSILRKRKIVYIHVVGNHKVYDRYLNKNKRR